MIIPAVRYRDVPAAAEWLCRAFGFVAEPVSPEERGAAARWVQLSFGPNVVMLGSATGSAFDTLMVQPDAIGNVATQCCHLVVPDAAAHYLRAQAAGAEIVMELADDGRGGKGYACRDPEGHLWSVGTYNPVKAAPPPKPPRPKRPLPIAPEPIARPRRTSVWPLALLLAVLAVPVAAVVGWVMSENDGVSSEAAIVEQARALSDNAAMAARTELERERGVRQRLEAEARRTEIRIADLEAQNAELTATAQSLQTSLHAAVAGRVAAVTTEAATDPGPSMPSPATERPSLATVDGAAAAATQAVLEVEMLRQASEAAERAAGEVRRELELERAQRAALERAAREAADLAAHEGRSRAAAERTMTGLAEELERLRIERQPPTAPTEPARPVPGEPQKKSSSEGVRPAGAMTTAAAEPVARAFVPIVPANPEGSADGEGEREGSTPTPATWAIYEDATLGFALSYPSDIFAPVSIPRADYGGYMLSRDGRAELSIFAGDNPSGRTIEAYRRSLIAESFSAATLDYAPVRKGWFVLSGRQGTDMFYVRITFACNGRKLHGWGLRYPIEERATYDRIVEQVHGSYRYGRQPTRDCA